MRLFVFIVVLLLAGRASCQQTDAWMWDLLQREATPLLRQVLSQPDSFQYQIIYTRIDRDAQGRPHFTPYRVNVDRNRYFNPASTVKLPTALAALEKVNGLRKKGIDKYTDMLTDSSGWSQTAVASDTSARNGLPSIAHYIKKIFLVSDNDAYNRLYEFAGQQDLNKRLHSKGYTDVRITRRFTPMTEEENRHTNAIRFVREGNLLYTQPAAASNFRFDYSKTVLVGRAHWDRHDSLIAAPMDFTRHNNLPLEDLQQMLQSTLFPRSVPKKQRFRLTEDDYSFLRQYLSALPSQSHYPNYDTSEYFDSYAKFFFKANRQKVPASIRIFNKTGWSYGYLTDAAYVLDTVNGVEFMLSAVIYVNADGVLNDNRYEYQSIGYPFFHDLFDAVYRYERSRERIHPVPVDPFAW